MIILVHENILGQHHKLPSIIEWEASPIITESGNSAKFQVNFGSYGSLHGWWMVHLLFLLLVTLNFASSFQSTLFHLSTSKARYLWQNCSLFSQRVYVTRSLTNSTKCLKWRLSCTQQCTVLIDTIDTLPSTFFDWQKHLETSQQQAWSYWVFLVGLTKPARGYFLPQYTFSNRVWLARNSASHTCNTNACVF